MAAIEREPERFDRLVTAEAVFPNPEVRNRYDNVPPDTQDGKRHYMFTLREQPGMVANRHFHVVTITWAPAGTWVKASPASATPAVTGAGSPNGGFVYATAQTADGAYDVQVGLGESLPQGVTAPSFNVSGTAQHMVRLYRASLSKP